MVVRHGVRPFVDLLYADAPAEAFTRQVDLAAAAGADEDELAALREELSIALRVREQVARHRQRGAGLAALYETANDLTAIRDVDAVLQAIVRRARQLLNADITYLSLNDESEGASFMRVTEGSVSAEFRDLRLPLGTGLLGLVAQRGAPYSTDDYFEDRRFIHRDYIDHAVQAEGIRAILGVPLTLDGKVIGALLAGNRSRRPFPPSEVALLGSFAAHAAIALENARLFEEIRAANEQIRAQSESVELAASAHDRLTDVLLAGGGAAEVAGALDGDVLVLDPHGRRLAGTTDTVDIDDRQRVAATTESRHSPARSRSTARPRRPGWRWLWRARTTSARWCCSAPRTWARPTGVPSSAVPWSPRCCCCSSGWWPTRRSGCAGSCSTTCSPTRPATRRRSPSAPSGRAPTWTASTWCW